MSDMKFPSAIQRFKAWRKRRYWASQHLEFLRKMIREDWRWLANEPVVHSIIERHHRAASTSWYELAHQGPIEFRESLRKEFLAVMKEFVLQEREACAKLCEEFAPKDDVDSGPEFAAAIRARNSG